MKTRTMLAALSLALGAGLTPQCLMESFHAPFYEALSNNFQIVDDGGDKS